jgi:hypothetical protein
MKGCEIPETTKRACEKDFGRSKKQQLFKLDIAPEPCIHGGACFVP